MALQRAGHTVAFGTAAGFAAEVEHFGFHSLAAGMEYSEWDEAAGDALAAMPERDSVDRMEAFGERLFAGCIARRLIEDLPGVLNGWPADLIVHEDTALGAAVVAEQLGIPHARFMIVAAGPNHPVHARADRAMAKLRASAGLVPASADDALHRHMVLYPFPPSLLLPGRPVPRTLRAVRPSLPVLTEKEELPNWLEELGDRGRPVVYATLGTIFNGPQSDDVFVDLLAALRDESVDAVVTIGRDRQPAEFGPQPGHVRLVQFVPLAAIMPRLDVVVSHGGSGTMIAALAHGLPQVVIPIGADQPENAERVASLGAGLVVGEPQRSADTIRSALRDVLFGPGYRLSARRLQKEIEALPSVDHAVALLERIAA